MADGKEQRESEPNEPVVAIDNTPEARTAYGRLYGSCVVTITDALITELRDGKCLAFNDGEYSTFIRLEG